MTDQPVATQLSPSELQAMEVADKGLAAVRAGAAAAAPAPASAAPLADGKLPVPDAKPPALEIKPAEQQILGKFKTQADLEKAYLDLEKRLSAPKADPKPGEPKPLVTPDELKAFGEAVTANGDLTAEQYKLLQDRGVDPALAKGYVDGLKAQTAEFTKQVFGLAGGQEGYAKMAEWASKTVPASELEVYAADVKSGDRARVAAAVSGMYARFAAAGGTAPAPQPRLAGTGSAAGGFGADAPFESTNALRLAMSDPRYKFDEAYQQSVIRRLANSNL